MTRVIKDTACLDVCPVGVIHPGPDEADFAAAPQLYIFPGDCINCAACVPACPVSAIYLAEDLPEKWTHFAEVNDAWYRRGVVGESREVTHG